jgi:phosphoribosylglycinamide formyltransferase-1
MQSLLDASSDVDWPASVVGVVTDRSRAGALDRARQSQVPTRVVSPGDFDKRADWDIELTRAVAHWEPDWVVSAGFMRLLGVGFLGAFPGRVVNTHPALLPAFPGTRGVADALDYGVKISGCTIHLVDAGVDTGPVLAQEAVVVEPEDTEAMLHERIKGVERTLLVAVISSLVRQGYSQDGRRVNIP